MFMFENLEVYRKSVDFCEKTGIITDGIPKGNYYLTDQLNRAALSIALNLAEGNGKWTKADRKNFFIIARGSLHECVPILELLKRKKLLTPDKCGELKKDLEIIAKMISGLIKGMNKRKQ